MDVNFIGYLVRRGINVERYQEASISEQGQILSVYEQQLQAPQLPGTLLDCCHSYVYFLFYPIHLSG